MVSSRTNEASGPPTRRVGGSSLARATGSAGRAAAALAAGVGGASPAPGDAGAWSGVVPTPAGVGSVGRGRRSRPPGALVYGPVASRRLGRSLGINLMRPGRTVCSFHCVYCEYARRPCPDPPGDWPSPGGVVQALARALGTCGRLDSITISGVGEPTEHPHFEVMVGAILGAARRLRPAVPVRILTNGANTVQPGVRRALDRLDERIVIVDARAAQVDRPDPRSPLGGIVRGVSLLRDFTAQSCFFEGSVSNASDAAVVEWAELLGEMQPRAVQIFTPSRPSASHAVRPVPSTRLAEIARILAARTGIEGRVFAN